MPELHPADACCATLRVYVPAHVRVCARLCGVCIRPMFAVPTGTQKRFPCDAYVHRCCDIVRYIHQDSMLYNNVQEADSLLGC
jgi:hypothetical protein